MAAVPKQQQREAKADDQLLAEFLETRDDRAFERLVVRHGPMVLRVCRDVLDDHAEAEDAFQATFIHLFRQGGTIRNRATVRYWLCEVAGRVARRARQRRSTRRTRERQAPTRAIDLSPDRLTIDREWRPIVREEIWRLPPKFRAAIELYYLEGLGVEAVARRLECPVGTLKSRLVKGRDLLRERLVRRGLAASAVLLLLFSFDSEGEAASAIPGTLVRDAVAGATGPPDASSRAERLLSDRPPSQGEGLFRWWIAQVATSVRRLAVWAALPLAITLGILVVLGLMAGWALGVSPFALARLILFELFRMIWFIGKHVCG